MDKPRRHLLNRRCLGNIAVFIFHTISLGEGCGGGNIAMHLLKEEVHW